MKNTSDGLGFLTQQVLENMPILRAEIGKIPPDFLDKRTRRLLRRFDRIWASLPSFHEEGDEASQRVFFAHLKKARALAIKIDRHIGEVDDEDPRSALSGPADIFFNFTNDLGIRLAKDDMASRLAGWLYGGYWPFDETVLDRLGRVLASPRAWRICLVFDALWFVFFAWHFMYGGLPTGIDAGKVIVVTGVLFGLWSAWLYAKLPR